MTAAPALSQVAYRGLRPDDEPFIYSAWLKSVRNDSHVYACVPDKVFYEGHHSVIERLLKSRDTEVTLACLLDDSAVLIGFAITDMTHGTMHFVYVKSPFRRMGVATGLLKTAGADPRKGVCTHWTKFLSQYQRTLWPGLVYNPYLLESA